ncbi:MAG TPA: signal recognition particle-docking protein FtsY, partial [Candidatus Acidoferrales bacterium]|nr:signal recognition particle-docking protein FtsY [Candidatus Acidoferrales bacterium]
PPEPTLLERLKESVGKTREVLTMPLGELLAGGRKIDDELLRKLETALLSADLGVRTTREVLAALREEAAQQKITDSSQVRGELKKQLERILRAPGSSNGTSQAAPVVIFVVGVNGTGKTTTIGKLANRLRREGRSVLLCAADTFRAAAIEQLEIWAGRNGVEMIRQKAGADPAAVVYDAMTAARARGVDVVIVDTAGRLHTKSNLMAELEKMKRTAAKQVAGAPHEVLLVLDATTGQNGLVQAREFTEHAGVTGLVLTKLDGTAKGGIAVAIVRELGLPIRFVGTGEQIDDLVPFDAATFVNSLLG